MPKYEKERVEQIQRNAIAELESRAQSGTESYSIKTTSGLFGGHRQEQSVKKLPVESLIAIVDACNRWLKELEG